MFQCRCNIKHPLLSLGTNRQAASAAGDSSWLQVDALALLGMDFRAFVNPAGGLRYHVRALRYSKTRWETFRWELGDWLLKWKPQETTLVLVGPSAGYCLQPFLFEQFERIVCLEPDPIARMLFKRKIRNAPLDRQPALEFIAEDHLVHAPERFPALVESLQGCCILFSNIIGQLRVLLSVADETPEFARVRDAVHEAIAGRSWASFHDRVSGTLRPSFDRALVSESRLTDDEILGLLYGESKPSRRRSNHELTDHLTTGFFPSELQHTYFAWELDPGRVHLIEAVAFTAT